MEAAVFDIYRGTSHDGPGLRSTVFFQGCPLKCQWCHNPEGIPLRRFIWWEGRSCIGCLQCVQACPRGAVQQGETGLEIRRDLCAGCGQCAAHCPTQAMRFTARPYTLEALEHEVMKDEAFYRKTGGGVTLSGGECLLQADFAAALLERLKARGVDTAVDTCGFVPWDSLEKTLPFTDHYLFDLKVMDEAEHRRWTGRSNRLILENLTRLGRAMQAGSTRADVWIRTPLIPGATATVENLQAIGSFLRQQMPGLIARWELPAFNNSCISKYQRLGRAWDFATAALLKQREADALQAAAARAIGPETPVIVTGLLAK